MGNLAKAELDGGAHLHRVEEVLQDDLEGGDRTGDNCKSNKDAGCGENNHPEQEVEEGKSEDDGDPAEHVEKRWQDGHWKPGRGPEKEAK